MERSTASPRFELFERLPLELRIAIWEFSLPGPRVLKIRQRSVKETMGQGEDRIGKEWSEWPGGSDWLETECSGVQKSVEQDDDTTQLEVVEAFDEEMLFRDRMRMLMGGHGIVGYRSARGLRISSDSKTAPIAYVSKEARRVFLKHYTASFYCTSSIPQTYFGYAVDTLYIRCDTFSKHLGLPSGQFFHEDTIFQLEDTYGLGKVRRLAVLFGRDHEYPGLEIAQILESGVKECAVVLRHFEDSRYYTRCVNAMEDFTEQKELILVDPTNMYEQIMDLYSTRFMDANLKDPVNRFYPINHYGEVKLMELDMASLRRQRSKDVKNGIFWEMPLIVQKVTGRQQLMEETRAATSMQKIESGND